MSDACDSGSDEEEAEEEEEEDDFIAPEDAETTPTMGAVFARHEKGRLMNPRVYAFFEVLLLKHTGDASKVVADMMVAFPALGTYDLDIALAQIGTPAAKTGDRVRVPFPD